MSKVRNSARGRSAVKAPPRSSVTVELICVALALCVSGLLFWRGGTDLFALPRATAFVALAVFLLVSWGVDAWRGHLVLTLPRGISVALAWFGALAALATLTASLRWNALIGLPNRATGLSEYLAYVVLFVAATRIDTAGWRVLMRVVVCVAAVASAYGVLQWLGADPFDWPRSELSTVFSTFGQTNFAAGWAAILLSVSLAFAMWPQQGVLWRRFGAVVFVAIVFFIGATEAFQGVIAGAVGVVVVVGLLAPDRLGEWRARASRFAKPFGLLLGGLLIVVLALPQPRGYVRSNLDSGLNERLQLWEAAGEMLRDAPLLGTGLASYPERFPSYRPSEHGRDYNYFTADAPHSVPLELAVGGGIPLLVAYVAFVLVVGRILLRGVRDNPDALLVGLGGAWVAYQVQALVSFDVPSLAPLHWIFAGAIVGLSSPARAVVDARTRRSARVSAPSVAPAVLSACAAVLVLSPWLSQPLRADRAVRQALDLARQSRFEEAIASVNDATGLAPWNATYEAVAANIFQAANRPDLALESAKSAIQKAPGSIKYRTDLAKLAVALGDIQLAVRQYERSLELDPHNAQLRGEIAAFNSQYGTSIRG
jgi:O-antigen ligase